MEVGIQEVCRVVTSAELRVCEIEFPGRAVAYVRTTQRQKFVCERYKKYARFKDDLAMIAKAQSRGVYFEKGTAIHLIAEVYIKGRRRIDVEDLIKVKERQAS